MLITCLLKIVVVRADHQVLAGPEEANLRWSGQEQGYTWIFFQLGKECGLGYGGVRKVGWSGGMLPQENFEIYNL